MAIPPAVAVDVPAELSPELSGSALRSCNLALGAGRCVPRDQTITEDPDVAWIAVLRHPNEPEASVRIELRAARSPESVVAVRQLDFQVTDAPSQRWATAGVVVAALVVGAESAEISEAEERPPAKPTPPEPRPAPMVEPPARVVAPKKSASAELRLDLAALAGPGLAQGPWRIGGQVRSSLGWAAFPLFGWVSITGSERGGAVSAVWWSGAAGAGLRWPTQLSPLVLDWRLGADGTRLELSTGGGQGSGHAVRTRWGAVAAVDLVLLASRHLHTVASFETTATWPRVVVNARSERVGTEPTVRWALLAGLRLLP
jgi:hypothetical protein